MEYADAVNYLGKMVKSWSKDSQQHGVPAILISIKNKHTCIIKPKGHKRSEECPLANIAKWDSRNKVEEIKEVKVEIKDDFYDNLIKIDKAIDWCNNNYYPIVRFKNDDKTIKAKLFSCESNAVSLILEDNSIVHNVSTIAFYEDDQKMNTSSEDSEQFVIVDNSTRMFWGGKKKWVKELIHIAKYNSQYGRSACTKVLKHSPNAELVSLLSIHILIATWNSNPISADPSALKIDDPAPAPVLATIPAPVPIPVPAPAHAIASAIVSASVSKDDDKILELKILLEQAYKDELAAEEMVLEARGRINKLKHEINIHKLMSL